MSDITATDILTAATTSQCLALAQIVWRAGNDAGEGFDPAEDLSADDLPIVQADGFAVYDIDGDAIIVADSNGSWAVRVSA